MSECDNYSKEQWTRIIYDVPYAHKWTSQWVYV